MTKNESMFKLGFLSTISKLSSIRFSDETANKMLALDREKKKEMRSGLRSIAAAAGAHGISKIIKARKTGREYVKKFDKEVARVNKVNQWDQ